MTQREKASEKAFFALFLPVLTLRLATGATHGNGRGMGLHPPEVGTDRPHGNQQVAECVLKNMDRNETVKFRRLGLLRCVGA